ncbi:surfeit locus protein 6 homolog [Portunus trituberculatus]|uniref:surfeit locus protein 6 homolog n=1 Tax=Portunus trituberculatus TaxID=210409 RepID=UPI001E1CFAE4|nr:surfeit locus protein 6 homolog [Portunus trituberculatus]
MNDIVANHAGKKFKKNKKKVKKNVTGEVKSDAAKEFELEDLAESVDSGCIPDSSSDIMTDLSDTAQIKTAVLKENVFISNLLRWLPLPLQSKEPDPEPEIKGLLIPAEGKKKKNEKKRKREESGPVSKRQKVNIDPTKSTADLDQLQETYQRTLDDLKKNRNKGNHSTRKKEAKLAKKLNLLEKRKDKRLKRKVKSSGRTEVKQNKKDMKKNLQEIQSSPKNVKPQKPIYNQKGELVFSKFDFSNSINLSGDVDTTMKSKDLKQILSQTLKEKEKMKHLEKKGDKEAAINIADQRAWSAALQKAEGKKVKSDVEMLKRSIKKREMRKKISQKKWEQRKETIQKQKTDKQNLRRKNIAVRREAKVDKKMKKMKKKGHIVPGF